MAMADEGTDPAYRVAVLGMIWGEPDGLPIGEIKESFGRSEWGEVFHAVETLADRGLAVWVRRTHGEDDSGKDHSRLAVIRGNRAAGMGAKDAN